MTEKQAATVLILGFAAVVGSMYLYYFGEMLYEARKKLLLLRDPSLWNRQVYEQNPWPAHGDLIYGLNLGGNLRPLEQTFSRAWLIGSTSQELWKLYRSVYRWYAGLHIASLRLGECVINRSQLQHYLSEAQCSLVDLGMTEQEFKELQRKVLFDSISQGIKGYQETKDPGYLLGLRPNFESADVAEITAVELEEFLGSEELDFVCHMLIRSVAERVIKGLEI